MRDQSELLEWVSACREGNARAQRRLFKHFYGTVMAICMRYAGNSDEAEDMLSDGFLRVFSNLDKYENIGSFEAWMKRVVRNAALDYRRKYDKNVDFVDIDEVADSQMADYHLNDAIAKMSSQEMVSLIQQLPPVTRTVFNLFVFEGFSHKEISQQLNITENTSAWHVNNARTRLKNAINQYDNGL